MDCRVQDSPVSRAGERLMPLCTGGHETKTSARPRTGPVGSIIMVFAQCTLSDIAAHRAEARCRKIKDLANVRRGRELNRSRVKAPVRLKQRKTETKMKTYQLKLRHIERRPPRCHFDALTPL